MLTIWGHSSTLQLKQTCFDAGTRINMLVLDHTMVETQRIKHMVENKGFHKRGSPKMEGLFIRQHPNKMDDLGVPQFRKYMEISKWWDHDAKSIQTQRQQRYARPCVKLVSWKHHRSSLRRYVPVAMSSRRVPDRLHEKLAVVTTGWDATIPTSVQLVIA